MSKASSKPSSSGLSKDSRAGWLLRHDAGAFTKVYGVSARDLIGAARATEIARARALARTHAACCPR